VTSLQKSRTQIIYSTATSMTSRFGLAWRDGRRHARNRSDPEVCSRAHAMPLPRNASAQADPIEAFDTLASEQNQHDGFVLTSLLLDA